MLKKIIDLYYTVWVDCITKIRNFDSFWWQYKSMMIMTFAMGVYFMIFMTIFQSYIVNNYFYYLDLKSNFIKPLASLISSFVLFFLPFLILNYFLIFYNKKYKKLIKIYKYHNGKYVMFFFFASMLLPILGFILLIVFDKVR